VGTSPPLKFLALGVGYWNHFGCLNEAVPDLFKEL
jgi:hypothetical protein